MDFPCYLPLTITGGYCSYFFLHALYIPAIKAYTLTDSLSMTTRDGLRLRPGMARWAGRPQRFLAVDLVSRQAFQLLPGVTPETLLSPAILEKLVREKKCDKIALRDIGLDKFPRPLQGLIFLVPKAGVEPARGVNPTGF